MCGYPAIRFGLHAAARAGARRAVVNVFHRGDMVQAVLGERVVSGVRLGDRDRLLGRDASCSEPAAAWPRRGRCSRPGRSLVMNAKVVADLDLPALLAAHGAAAAPSATMLLRDDPDAAALGRDRRRRHRARGQHPRRALAAAAARAR